MGIKSLVTTITYCGSSANSIIYLFYQITKYYVTKDILNLQKTTPLKTCDIIKYHNLSQISDM
jgi:hypothetical protein